MGGRMAAERLAPATSRRGAAHRPHQAERPGPGGARAVRI